MNNLIIKKLCLLYVLILSNFKGIVLCQFPEKPNVLLIYVDDLRPELSSYGVTYIQSPNIDALAEKGIKFTNAYCNVPVCGHLAQAC